MKQIIFCGWNMSLLIRFACCAVLLFPLGCSLKPQNDISVLEIKQCKSMCAKRLDSCKLSCTDNCPRCSAEATHVAAVNYLNYIHEKEIEGGSILRVLKSYRDPLQCRKVTCNCSADFATCNQGCTGIIQKRLRSAPYCT